MAEKKLNEKLEVIAKSMETLQQASQETQAVLKYLLEKEKRDEEVRPRRTFGDHDYAGQPAKETSEDQADQTAPSPGGQSLRKEASDAALYPGPDEPIWPLLSTASQDGDTGVAAIQTEDIQLDFKMLQDVYARLRVHSDVKFKGSKAGVKQNVKDAVNVVCSSARYAELMLKILIFIHRKSKDPGFKVNDQLQEMYLCAFALLRYLQDEYAGFMCESDFGVKTKKFFKSLMKDSSAYPVASLQKLELAGRLACIPTENEAPSRRGGYTGWSGGPRGGFRNVRMRGRGFGRGSYQQQQYQQSDSAPPFTPRHVPFDRQSTQEN